MSESVHGREVVALLTAQPAGINESVLLALIEQTFPVGLFHTCKVKGMDKNQILANMMTKGRIVEQNGILTAQTSCGCKH
ncbi:MAG: putative metal-binding protein [Moritella dasanensis]|jgi:probable metal-binding protein